MILIHPEKHTVTPSSGSATQTIKTKNHLLKWIHISPATATTTYDFTLTDVYDHVIFDTVDEVGKYSEPEELPTYGNLTLTISNASVDEVFNVLMAFREQ